MQGREVPLSQRDTGTGNGSADVDITFTAPTSPGQQWHIYTATAKDQNNGFTSIRVYKKVGSTYYPISETTSPSAGVYYELLGSARVILDPGESLVIRFVGTTNSDALEAAITGIITP